MTESSASNQNSRVRRVVLRCLLAAIAFFAAFSLYSSYRDFHPSVSKASIGDVNSIVAYQSKKGYFKKAGKYLATTAKKPGYRAVSSTEMDKAVAIRVVVEFLKSLSPEQIERLSAGLQYTEMNSTQKDMLRRLPRYVDYIGKPLDKSLVTVEVWRSNSGSDFAQFKWFANQTDEKKYYPVGVSFNS